jgi:hypothetical protein
MYSVQNFCTSCVHIKLLVCLYSVQYVETFIIDHVVSLATTPKMDIKCKLLQMKENLEVKNLVVTT